LEREHDNFRAALRWSLDSDQPEDALRLASALGRFWALHGHLTEGQQWLDETLSRATTSHATPPLRARALNASGGLARDRGDYPQALAQLAECVALLRALAGPRGLALALSNLAVAAQLAGEHARASAALEESLALFRQSDDRQGIASALMTLGVIRRQRGEHNQAQDALQEALIAFRELGDKRGMAASLNNLGNLANAQNNLGAAREHYEQSLALLRELGDMREVAASQLNLAIVARDQHDLAHSVALARQSLTVLIELGDNGAGAACVEIMAGIAADTGAPEAAARLYGAAAALAQSAGAQLPIMDPGDYTARVAALRVRLGADQYERARASGQALGPREAAALALASSSEAEPGHQTDADGVRLTRREREVAALLARGVTNREIAQALVITPGTAALHVEHLRAKLGCHSRAQVAAWAVAHGLADYVPHR
jgi:DNA-binding CsgD family transcriptional regulator/tetratricopeptide (TPR) repeat protein